MLVQSVRQTRVLLGNLEPMLRLGMSQLLADDGVLVVAEEGRPLAILAETERLHPDVVVLDRDAEAVRRLGEELRARSPQTKVILWARDETEMEVFDPGSSEPRLVQMGASAALLSELANSHRSEEGK